MKAFFFAGFLLAAPVFVGAQAGESNDVVRAMILLKSQDPAERKESALRLAALKDPRAVEPLIDALKDKSPEVRASAAYALGVLGDQRAVKDLIRLGEKDENALAMVLRSLGKLKDPSGLNFIQKNLSSEDPLVVFEAALALGEFPSDTGAAALIGALPKTDSYGCRTIVNVLGRKRAVRALPALRKIMDSNDAECRLAAVAAFGRMGSREALPLLKKVLDSPEETRLKIAALESLGHIPGDETLSLLIHYAKLINPDLRIQAIHSLGELGDPRARPHLTPLLQLDDPAVREAVEFALARMGNPG